MRTTPTIRRADATDPPEAFTIEAPVRLEDRVAAALFAYADLFAAARRRQLHLLIWVVIALLAMAYYSSWQESGHLGARAFLSRFGADLLGLGGLPILVVAGPMLAYYLVQPALIRSRLKRWYRDERLDRPIATAYRFEPGGIAVTLPGRGSALACRRIGGISESPTHLFIRLKDIEDVFALPRSALSGEQVAQIGAWAASCHVDGAGAARTFPELETPPGREPLLTARFELTEDDRAVALGWQMERPGTRRRRRRGFILAFLVAALIPPLLFGVLWLLDPERVPFRYAFPLFVEMFASTFWKWVLGLWAIMTAVILLHPWMRRRHARQLARQMQKRVQAYEHEVRLYDDGLETWQDSFCNRFDWKGFERIERRGDHLILLRREGEPLILPLRALDGDKLAIFQRIVDHRIDGGSHRPEAGT